MAPQKRAQALEITVLPTPRAQPRRARKSLPDVADLDSDVVGELETFPDANDAPEFPSLAPPTDLYNSAATTAAPVSRGNIAQVPPKIADKNEAAKSGPPTMVEWQNFFARFVIRVITEAWLFLMLGNIIDQLTPDELERITLAPEQMADMAAPMAEVANKTTFMRKHGRLFVGIADSVEAGLDLTLWMVRVMRIARKYRPAKPARSSQPNPGAHTHGNDGRSNGASQSVNPVAVFNPGSG